MNKSKWFSLLLLAPFIVACGNVDGTSSSEGIDLSKFPLYVEDTDSITYDFNDEAVSNPFWKGNVIYNETVLLTKDSDTEVISGKLAYTPTRIISVRDYTLKYDDTVIYQEGVDFEVNGNVITAKSERVPFLLDKVLTGDHASLPTGYNIVSSISNIATDVMDMGGTFYTESDLYYGRQLSVTYTYDVNEIVDSLDNYPSYKLDSLPRLKAKLEAGDAVKIAALGDSVLEGCSSSKKFNHKPFMDNFMEMTRDNLARLYGSQVTLDNQSVGGKTSAWGALDAQINGIVNSHADVLFLHFGINDLGANTSPASYVDNMETIVCALQDRAPDMDIILITPIGVNPTNYDYQQLDKYNSRLVNVVVEEKENITYIDATKMSYELYKNKKYQDMTANGINHVNDYASRLYLQSILSTLYQY